MKDYFMLALEGNIIIHNNLFGLAVFHGILSSLFMWVQKFKVESTAITKPHHCYLECWSMHHTSEEALLMTCVN